MKSILLIVVKVFAVFLVAVCIRVSFRKAMPGTYASVFGVPIQGVAKVVQPIVQSSSVTGSVLASDPEDREKVERNWYPVGYVRKGNRIDITMSDGSVLTETQPGLERVERNAIYLKGKLLYIRPRPVQDRPVAALAKESKIVSVADDIVEQPAVISVSVVKPVHHYLPSTPVVPPSSGTSVKPVSFVFPVK